MTTAASRLRSDILVGDTVTWRAGNVYEARVEGCDGTMLTLGNIRHRKRGTKGKQWTSDPGEYFRRVTRVSVLVVVTPPKLGAAQLTMLKHLSKHAEHSGDPYDPGALNPRKALMSLVALGLSRKLTEFGWWPTHVGLALAMGETDPVVLGRWRTRDRELAGV